MGDPRWTDETEDRLVRAVIDERAKRWGFTDTLDADELERWKRRQREQDPNVLWGDIRAALAALADAGLLVEPGGETVVQWRVTGEPGHGYPPYSFVWPRPGHPEDGEKQARAFAALMRDWDDGPHLSRRTVHTGPWRPAEEVGGDA